MSDTLIEPEDESAELSQADVDADDVARIAEAVDLSDPDLLIAILRERHPADIADLFEQLANEQLRAVVRLIPREITGDVLTELEDDSRELVLDELNPVEVARAILDLETDDAIEVVEDMEEGARAEVLAAVPARDRKILEQSLAFDEETAGRLMQREFVAAPEFWTVGDAIDHMRAAGGDLPELFFEIYVVSPDFKPIGEVPVSHLMRSPRETSLSDIMLAPRALIRPEMDQEEAAYLFEKYHLISAPVVDESGRLSGMITVDDMVDVIQEENKEDMLALAGVTEAGLSDTVLSSVRSRAPWLFVNLLTAVAASAVIALFEAAIAQLVALAVLMPIVASMGGNAGTQSLAVAVRALASRDLTSANARRIIVREMLTGVVNGLIFAVVMAIVASVWFGRADLGLVIAIAMIVNLASAGLSGIVIPLALKRFGADPAVASSVFVTTVTDMVGFFVFLGLAAWMLL